MIYTCSLLGFILYDITIKCIEIVNKKINKYKPIYQYTIIQENNNDIFDIFCVALLFLPIFLQNIIMFCYVSYIINKLYNVYLTERQSNYNVYIKTPNTILGIFITINTIINSFNNIVLYHPNDIHLFYGSINIICLYLLTNKYNATLVTFSMN